MIDYLWQYGCHLSPSCHRFCVLSLHFLFTGPCCSKMLPQLVQKLSTELLGAQQVPGVSCLFEGDILFCSSTSFKYFSLGLRGWILSRQQLQTTLTHVGNAETEMVSELHYTLLKRKLHFFYFDREITNNCVWGICCDAGIDFTTFLMKTAK